MILSRQLWKLEIINISCGLVACFEGTVKKNSPKRPHARRNFFSTRQAAPSIFTADS
jgi:hypothetical protein